jgi:hypothetical protein
VSGYDWTTEDGAYRHFYFCEQCEDTDSEVLALITDCFARLGDVGGYLAYVRVPLTINRGVRDFTIPITLASVCYRVAIDLRSRDKNYEYMPVVGFGLAKEEA